MLEGRQKQQPLDKRNNIEMSADATPADKAPAAASPSSLQREITPGHKDFVELMRHISEGEGDPESEAVVELKLHKLQKDITLLRQLTKKKISTDEVNEVATVLKDKVRNTLHEAQIRETEEKDLVLAVINFEETNQEQGGRKEYVGALLGDNRHGYGVMYWHDGTVYKGDWLQDKPTGYGCETYSDGSTYKGEYLYDSRHGDGVFISPDQDSRYLGQWKKGERHGTGAMIRKLPSGKMYRAICKFEM